MSLNPKFKKLADIPSKDINKKAIDKLGKKFNTETGKQAPFFIKLSHKFPDGTEGGLFIFGKLNAFKSEIKDAISKDATKTLRGLALVEYDAKGNPTLVLNPVKGKLDNKPVEITKAMKAAFTTAYSSFKIGAPIDEKAAEALEAAAENEVEEADDEASATQDAPAKEEAAKPKTKEEAVAAKLTDVVGRIEKLLADYEAAKSSGDAEKAATLEKEVASAFAEVAPKK